MTLKVPDSIEFAPGKNTYLCRWDTGEEFNDGVSEVSSGSVGSSDYSGSGDFDEGPRGFRHSDIAPINLRRHANEATMNLRNSDTTGTRSSNSKTYSPPSPPKRSVTPPMNGDRWGNIKSGKKALNCKRASEQSGVDINDIMLQPIQFMDLKPVPKSNHTLPLSDILLNSTATEKSAARLQVNAAEGDDSNKVTAVFCIRRAGCGMCRDHGLSLSTQLKPKLHEKGIGLNLFGIVKDLDGSGEGDVSDHRRDRKDKKTSAKILTDFYTNYFPFPMYTDRNWHSFTFLGNRKTSMWKMFQRSSTVYQRYHRKKISNIINDPRGDPLTQGGVLLFDAKGHLRYVYYERYGDELDLEALQWAVQDIVRSTGASSDRNMSNKKEPTVAPRLPRRRGTFDKGLMAGAVGSGGEKPNKNSRDNAPNGIRKPQRRGSIDDAEKAYDLQVQDDGSFDSKQ